MTKRIPSQSAFKGISTKQWVRFVMSLSEEESHFLINNCCTVCSRHESDLCDCADVLNSLMEKVYTYLPSRRDSSTYFPPQKLLVGIELNPGPPKVTTVVVSKAGTRRKLKSKSQERITTVSTIPRNSMTRMASSGSRRGLQPINNSSNSFLRKYINTVQDPWEFGPLSLGYGTLIETAKATGYLRSSITVNADGSFGLALLPQVTNMVIQNVSGAAGTTWTNNSASNLTSITNQFSGARIVSGGLRAFCLFPDTSTPGVLFSGSVPGQTITGFSTQGPTALSSLATSELGVGSRGARSVLLPTDMSAFIMTSAYLTAGQNPNLLSFAFPYIAGIGFPAGTIVWYEAVINLEGIPIVSTSGVGIDADRLTETAADSYVTPERLMRAASGLLTSTTVMDAVQGLASMANPALGRGIGAVRSVFGQGRNFSQALVSGRSSNRQSYQNSVVIEEMKEDTMVPSARGRWINL